MGPGRAALFAVPAGLCWTAVIRNYILNFLKLRGVLWFSKNFLCCYLFFCWPFLSLASSKAVPSQNLVSSSRSEEHTSELQSRLHLVCRLLLEKKKNRMSHLRSLLDSI